MIVTRGDFARVLGELLKEPSLAFDTETTGLRMYHGDRLFSFIISTATTPYYFNFLPYAGVGEDFVLPKSWLARLMPLWNDASKLWFIQNAANFDLCIAAMDGVTLAGEIHCTKAIGRVEYNNWPSYSLEHQLERLGHAKDDAVKKYVEEHKLFTKVKVPGKAQEVKYLHYDRVPFDIIVPYGETDGLETHFLGRTQIKSITDQDTTSKPGCTMTNVMLNERRLQKTIFKMRHQGVLIDRKYCEKAALYEADRELKAKRDFERECGAKYSSSPKLFASVFAGEKDKWEYTEKNNPSFESDVLKKFIHPGARAVLDARDAKSKSDFYQGFLYHADSSGRIHPNYNPEGAAHGRFSSSEPNFQNLTSEEDEASLAGEFIVRRAIIPSPGFIFIMPDYDQMEYRFMLEMACLIVGHETKLVGLIKGGLDVHEATAKVASETGVSITRYAAKTSNFLTLYGGGNKKLADGLACSIEQAKAIRGAIFQSAPEIRAYINHLMYTAEKRGFIVNWLGRRSHFPNRAYAYRAPNHHTSGGCADIVKVAMNRVDDALQGLKSRMIMTVHDELPIEVHESEVVDIPQKVKELMEGVFTSEYLPLTCGMEWSAKSLGDKVKGFPA